MILYFSGTGNSKYVAKMLGDLLSDTVVSLNDIMKYDKLKVFNSELPFVVVAPIYAWRFPKNVDSLLGDASFIGCKKIYFISTFVSESGLTGKYSKKLCKMKRLEFMGYTGVRMPDNYIINDIMPDKQTVEKIISEARPVIAEIAENIKSGNPVRHTDNTPLAWTKSKIINRMFSRFAMNSNSYVVSGKCVSCGKCVELCPVNNISINGSKPTFGNDCMACYACIHHCPTAAINIGGKTENHGRYVCPEYDG